MRSASVACGDSVLVAMVPFLYCCAAVLLLCWCCAGADGENSGERLRANISASSCEAVNTPADRIDLGFFKERN